MPTPRQSAKLRLAALLVTAATLAATGDTAAQQPAAPTLQADLAALDGYIAAAREAWGVPGLAVAIVKDGETVLAKGYGVRELGGSEPVDAHTLFAIASNSKAFTAAALAMLVDEGRLSWDDRVRAHLPWFQLYDPYVSEEMRIRDLLSHRSGLGTYSGDLLWYGTPYSAEDVVRRARHLEPAGPFRASYGYSNLMFIAAGEVVRVVSGQPWQVFVRERILSPLAMNRTVTSTDSLVTRDNVASPHAVWQGTLQPFAWYNWDAMAAAGGIISSVSEMARWLELQLDSGVVATGDTLFSPRQAWTMWSVHTPFTVSPQYRETYPTTNFRGYGLGWSLNDYKGRKIVSHGGGYDGMFSRTVFVPDENLGVVVLTNSTTGISTAISNRILDAYLGGDQRDWSALLLPQDRAAATAEAERRARIVNAAVQGTRPSLSPDAYAGTYSGPMYGDATVTVENGGLVLRLLPNSELVADLRHRQHDTYTIEWRRPWPWFGNGVAHFVLTPAGTVGELRLDVPNEDLWFDELVLEKKS